MIAGSKQQYLRVADDLRMRIMAGEWALNMPIPSRRSLAREYQVALNTVGQAVSMLMTEGLLRADGRRGTLVASANPLYVPASDLGRRSSRLATIGIIATVHTNHVDDTEWAFRALLGCEAVLADEMELIHQFYNYDTRQAQADAQLAAWITTMLDAGLDALIIIQQHEQIADHLQPVVAAGIPVICVTLDLPSLQTTLVTYDQTDSGYQAAQHLLQRGYRDLVFWAPLRLPWTEERQRGILRAIGGSQHADVTLRVIPDAPGDPATIVANFTAYAYQEALTLLPTVPPGAGIIAMNDRIATGILQAANTLGMMVGRDFGILGFDDFPTARQYGLTALRPPMEAMGQTAARIVLDGLRHKVPAPAAVALRATLIPRSSSSPLVS